MATTVQKVLEVASQEVGYRERPVNRTKYGAYFGLNGHQWCGMFVNWVFEKAKGKLVNTIYTPAGAAAFRALGRFYTKGTVQPGDIVYFNFPNDNLDRISHVGIAVKQVSKNEVLTIEGNTGSSDPRNGGEVAVQVREKKFIVGWGRPVYKIAPAPIVATLVSQYVKKKGK